MAIKKVASVLTKGVDVLFFFWKGHLAYSNAKLLTQMHMELFGIRNGTKVWFGPRCKVACIGDIQFCTISKLARHRKGRVVAQLSQGWATHNLQTGTWLLRPNRRIGCLTQINCEFTAGCCQALVRDGCQVLTLEQEMRKKNTCVEPWIPQGGHCVTAKAHWHTRLRWWQS